ncbi:MAG: hypothetical protein P4L40_20710, partial [Terracidiphilus sp.]|nr:hypothetical protein [Terracidiphilus sp.]
CSGSDRIGSADDLLDRVLTLTVPSRSHFCSSPQCRPGHSFHRDCVASWIKLKDVCPACQLKV